VLPAVPGLERLVEEAGAVYDWAQFAGGGAVACDLVLRRAEVGHGGGGEGTVGGGGGERSGGSVDSQRRGT
jgi:hypothetical protein